MLSIAMPRTETICNTFTVAGNREETVIEKLKDVAHDLREEDRDEQGEGFVSTWVNQREEVYYILPINRV